MKFFYLFAVVSLSASASVQEICSLDQPKVERVTNLDQLEDNICEFRDSSNDREITRTSQQSLQILNRLRSNPAQDPFGEATDPMNDPALVESLKKVSNLVTGRRSPARFASQRSDALGASMNQLFSRFGTLAQRNANKEGYYQAMKSVLSQTREGARVIQCFERLDPGATKTLVEFAESGEAAPTATYEARFDQASNSYHKVIGIGVNDSPALTLSLLAHEMQHACNTPEFMQLDRQMRDGEARLQRMASTPGIAEVDLTRAAEEFGAQQSQLNLRYAIDELRAYRMTPAIFSELAPYHPEFFCNQYYVSSLFGRQILGTGDYMSSVETMVADGTFAHNLIETYTSGSGYNPAVFYQMDESTGDMRRDPQGRPLFRPEVKAQIEREGFRVP